MPEKLCDIVKFRGDRLFNGAVNIGWLGNDERRTRDAAEAFVFHGPAYHGVAQSDVGESHGHRLQDTATFASSVIRRCYGAEEQSFTLAIAGYGTGKSHLALALGALLREPAGKTAEAVLSGIESADAVMGNHIKMLLAENCQPCLVVALDGMQNFDLASEITRQILVQVKSSGLDARPLDNLRPRFAQAASLIQMAVTNIDVVRELLAACDLSDIKEILSRLGRQDEVIYSKVHEVLASKNIKISALGGESVQDVIDVTAREYCGAGKPFRSLVVLFDEFGRYTEFAAGKSHIAGSGALQSLFQGMQNNTQSACFVGFIQYELNAYVQRVAPEHRAEITRYVTRYQTASRVYLSINLETLIASLIEKKQSGCLHTWFSTEASVDESLEIMGNIAQWFPQSANHRIWSDQTQFHTVIRKGCWPLSAYSTWFLFHLASAGKHLQERSALALLGDALRRFDNHAVDKNQVWSLAPVDLWSDDLKSELLTAEDGGQQGSITHAYASIDARHGSKFNATQQRLLRAVVLASKMSMKALDRDDAVTALSELAGVHLKDADTEISELSNNLNVLAWDDAFKAFDILGDAVPRSQFLAFIRQRVASAYDEDGKSKLFAGKAASWCDLLGDIDCDFADESKIKTREWRCQAVTTNLDFLLMQVKQASNRWCGAVSVDEPRGTVIYCYVEPSRDPAGIDKDIAKLLRAAAQEAGSVAQPILIVLLHDEDGVLGQSLAELAILDESINEQERLQFGNLIAAHKEKTLSVLRSRIEGMIKQRRYVSAFREPFDSGRLSRVCSEMFARIYKSPVPFPFDGFSTKQGNGYIDCQALTSELLLGRLDWNGITAKPIRVKNRAVAVLHDSWGIFAQNNGSVKTRPTHPIIRSLTEKWDELLASGEKRILLEIAVRQLCAPPYGANLASAGLFLGVFLSPRLSKMTIARAGQSIAVTEWLNEGVFRGNFIDVGALHNVELLHLGDESSEWDKLLDEWEQAESYVQRKACYIRAEELKRRIPVPPAQAYRAIHLEEQGKAAFIELNKMDEAQNDAINKIDYGSQKNDVALLSWGASSLFDLAALMTSGRPLWTDHEIQGIEPIVARTRQSLIQMFPDWLKIQAPRDSSPKTVGDFSHVMIRKVGAALKKLKLDEQYAELEKHTNTVLKQVASVAEAQQMVSQVRLWISSHGDSTRFARVAELRALQQVGKEHSTKLQGLASRIQVDMSELSAIRIELSNAITAMTKAVADAVSRLKKLWKSKLESVDSMDLLQDEVDALLTAFEGCSEEHQSLQIIRRALRMYQQDYQRLSDVSLTWRAFEDTAAVLKSEAIEVFVDGVVPWAPAETIDYFVHDISKKRDRQSAIWIDALAADAASVGLLPAADAKRLHDRASNTPAILASKHASRLSEILKQIKSRLDDLKVDWLVEEFNELSPMMRKKFLSIVS